MASNPHPELNELLDGALDDFQDPPLPSTGADSAAAAAPADEACPPASGGAAAAGPAASSLHFDPLGRSSPKPGSHTKGSKGPSLPPRSHARAKTAAPGQQPQAAPGGQHSRSADSAGPSNDDRAAAGTAGSTMPDLAATLQALAVTGPDSAHSRNRGDGAAPDMEATLRSAAAAVAASASSGPGSGAEGDELLKELAQQLQGLGGGGGGDASDPEEMDAMVGVILKQLLSKQVLHQSMKDIGERYPQWLAKHAGSLSDEDLARYTQQHQHISEMCRLYEEDADNFTAIFSQLQKMQACGTPPDEIVQELSPGLQFDADGMPKPPDGGPPGCGIQ